MNEIETLLVGLEEDLAWWRTQNVPGRRLSLVSKWQDLPETGCEVVLVLSSLIYRTSELQALVIGARHVKAETTWRLMVEPVPDNLLIEPARVLRVGPPDLQEFWDRAHGDRHT